MIPENSMSRSKGRWPELRCSDLWCRSWTGGQSASSPSGLILSTIPKSISDGVSKCSLTPVSDASGSRPGTAALRPRRSTACSLIISKNCAMAVRPSIQPMVNAFAVHTIPARRCKPGRRGWELEGGRGFVSSERGRSATAPDVMRRFFSCARTFEYFSRIQIFKRQTCNLRRQNNAAQRFGRHLRGFIFSAPRPTFTFRKNVAKFRGGRGYVMTAFSERAR
jgi:hypothetical protein